MKTRQAKKRNRFFLQNDDFCIFVYSNEMLFGDQKRFGES